MCNWLQLAKILSKFYRKELKAAEGDAIIISFPLTLGRFLHMNFQTKNIAIMNTSKLKIGVREAKTARPLLSWPNHCTLRASSCSTTNDWNSYYFVKLVRWKNNKNASNMRWLGFELWSEWKSDYQIICLLLSRGSIWQIFLLTDKKRADKKIIYEPKKLMSLVCDINYYLIVSIERAPQRLYSQCYSYRWRHSTLYLPPENIRKL